jgi:hypothetical protein
MTNYRSGERQAVRMLQMMRRLDVDPGDLIRERQGEAYSEARARCLACLTIGECLRWLDGYNLEGEQPGFCPNVELFLSLKGKRARAPREGLDAAGAGCAEAAPRSFEEAANSLN